MQNKTGPGSRAERTHFIDEHNRVRLGSNRRRDTGVPVHLDFQLVVGEARRLQRRQWQEQRRRDFRQRCVHGAGDGFDLARAAT